MTASPGARQGDDGFAQYLAMLRRWWWALALAPLLGAAVAYLVALNLPPRYEATATLLVTQRPTAGVVQLNDLQASERLAKTFSRLIAIRPVLDRAIEQGELAIDPIELERRLSVANPASTELLEVTAEAGTAVGAAHLANTVATAFIESNEAALSVRPGLVSVVERAEPPLEPVFPNTRRHVLAGAVLALVAVVGLTLLLDYLDDTIKRPEQVLEAAGLPTLARVPAFSKDELARGRLPAATHRGSACAEAYRAARTSLAFTLDVGAGRKVVLVTSPGAGDGKTATVANLAVVFGLAGHRVCAVDADLRRPSLHRALGVREGSGLTRLLLASDRDAMLEVQQAEHANVSVLAAGPLPSNPSELLGSNRMQQLIEALRERFDVVLLDSPPALAVTDASVLSTLADLSLVVVSARRTRKTALGDTVEALSVAGHTVAGVVLNRVRAGVGAGYTYAQHGYEAERARSS
jgi:non-specific protein-tyrosine kinase